MTNSISIKQFRNNMAKIATEAEKGSSFIVIRRSKPSFKIVPFNGEDDGWETVVDFTEKGKKTGENIKDVLKALRKLNK